MEWIGLISSDLESPKPDTVGSMKDALLLEGLNCQFRAVLNDIERCRKCVTKRWRGDACDAFNTVIKREIKQCHDFARAVDFYVGELKGISPDRLTRKQTPARAKSESYQSKIQFKVFTADLARGARMMQESADAMQNVLNRMVGVLSRQIPERPFRMPGSSRPEADFSKLRRKLLQLSLQFHENAHDLREIYRVYESAEQSLKQQQTR